MSKHTPGPWATASEKDGYYACTRTWVIDSKNRGICKTTNSTRPEMFNKKVAEAEANARLIAAAPELLALLEEAAPTDHAGKDELCRLGKRWNCRARAAIARAKGEKP